MLNHSSLWQRREIFLETRVDFLLANLLMQSDGFSKHHGFLSSVMSSLKMPLSLFVQYKSALLLILSFKDTSGRRFWGQTCAFLLLCSSIVFYGANKTLEVQGNITVNLTVLREANIFSLIHWLFITSYKVSLPFPPSPDAVICYHIAAKTLCFHKQREWRPKLWDLLWSWKAADLFWRIANASCQAWRASVSLPFSLIVSV